MRQRKRGSLSKVCSLLEEYMWVHLGVVESNSRLSLLSGIDLVRKDVAGYSRVLCRENVEDK